MLDRVAGLLLPRDRAAAEVALLDRARALADPGDAEASAALLAHIAQARLSLFGRLPRTGHRVGS